MPVTIPVLTGEEAEQVAPSLQRLIMELSSSVTGPDSATVAARVRDERIHVLVAERQGVIVGTATLSLLMTLWKGMVGTLTTLSWTPQRGNRVRLPPRAPRSEDR